MTVWVEAVPAVLAATAVLVLPGMLAALAVGLRGIAAWGTAPLLSVAIVSGTAVVLPLLGIQWSLRTLAVAVVAAVGLAWLTGGVLHRAGSRRVSSDDMLTLGSAALGLAAGAFLLARTVARGITLPSNISQTYDAVFHLNAVRFVLDTANASSLHIGGMVQSTSGRGFYPGAWHAAVAGTVELSGVDIPTATNAVALVVSAVLWPAGAVLLTRQLLGPDRLALLAAGVLSAGFFSLPYVLLIFGVLYPNVTAFALLPGALAVVVSLLGRGEQDAIRRGRAAVVLPLGLLGLGLAHPNALFSLVVLVLPLAVSTGVAAGVDTWRSGRATRVVVWTVVTVMAVGSIWVVLARSAFVASVMRQSWAASGTKAQASGEVLLQGMLGREAFTLLAILVLAGFVVMARTPRLRWVPAAYLLVAWLYVLARGSDSELSSNLTGLWYNDSYRLASILPVLGTPMAVVGLLLPRRWLEDRRRQAPFPLVPEAITVAALAGTVVATGGMYVDRISADISQAYRLSWSPDLSILLTESEQELFTRIGEYVPEGAVVAGNPWNGSSLVSALGDRDVVFPHFVGAWDEPREILIEGMRDVASDPEVCSAARELGVEYVIDGGRWIVEFDRRAARYSGFEDLGTADGLERVARYGETTLYRVTECAEG